MNKSEVSPMALSAGDMAHLEGGPSGPAAAPPRSEGAARLSGWTAGRVVALVMGALLVLVALGLLGAGGTALWADRTQRDAAGYITTNAHTFSTPGSALATERTDLGSAGWGWLYSPTLLDKVRIRVTPVTPGSALFVGIGPFNDVGRYLVGVNHTVITDFWGNRVQPVNGGPPAAAPGAQAFWAATATGPGEQTLPWEPASGSWSVVVMNVDGRPGVDVRASIGARMPALPWIAGGSLTAGAVLAVGGALLIVGAIRCDNAGRTKAG